MTDIGLYRLGALSGIVGVALYVAAFMFAGLPPAPDSSSLKIAQALHDHREGLLAATVLFTLGSTVYVWFISVVRTALAQAEESRGTLANAFFASALAAVIFAPLGLVPAAAGALKLAAATGPQLAARADLIRFLYDLSNITTTVGSTFLAVGAFAVAVIVLRTHIMPRWIGLESAVLAALSVLAAIGVAAINGPFAVGGPVFLISFLAFIVWTVALGLELFRKPGLGAPTSSTARVGETTRTR